MKMLIIMACAALIMSDHTVAQTTHHQSTMQEPIDKQQTDITDNLKQLSGYWNLTEIEYLRYLELMKGPRSAFSVPNITPIEVLGIHAKTQAEREKYAALWVSMTQADTERVLEFQNAVNAAWQSQYPHGPLVSPAKINQLRAESKSPFGPINELSEPVAMSLTGRTLFFTKPDCPICDQQLNKLMGMLENGKLSGLDIYLGDVGVGDVAIQQWAKQRQLPIEKLRSKQVTLNHDQGTLELVSTQLGQRLSIPSIIQRRGNQYQSLSAGLK